MFYEEAKRALEQVKYAFSRVEASSPEPSGLLRITAPMTLGVSLVGPLVSATLANGELVRILDAYTPPTKPVQMVYPRSRKSLPKMKAFIDFVAQRLA